MNSEVANQLKALIKQYGTKILDEPKRYRALMMDLCGDNLKEIRVLQIALESNVPRELLSSNNIPYEILSPRLAQKLVNEYALAEDAALWSVESWAFAFELQTKPLSDPREKLTKQDDSSRREKQTVSTAKEISDHLNKRLEEADISKLKGVNAVYLFNISEDNGGVFHVHVVVKDGKPSIVESAHHHPDITITMAADEFNDLLKGKLSALSAFTVGKLKVKGSMALFMKLQSLIS